MPPTNIDGSIRKLDGLEALRLGGQAANKKAISQLQTVADIFEDLKTEAEVQDRTKLISNDEGDSFEVPAKIIGGVPIQVAVEQLAETYAVISSGKETDMMAFVETYTARKFATIIDIFGYGYRPGDPNDLGENTRGVIGTTFVEALGPFDNSEMFRQQTNAKEGFHSTAFGDWRDMEGLEHAPLVDAKGVNKKKIDPSVDPRGDRYYRALAYRDGLLGVLAEKS